MRAGDLGDEGAVKGGVVREHGVAAHEFRERGDGVPGVGRVGDHRVGDVRELGDLGRDELLGVHEGVEALHDVAPRDACRRDLDELAVAERQTRRLGVEHDDVLLEQAEVRGPRTLLQAEVALPYRLGRPRHQQLVDQCRMCQ